MAEAMSDKRLAELDAHYGEAGTKATSATKQQLRAVIHELLDDARMQRRELAKHKPGPVLRAWRGDNGDIIHGETAWIRQAISTHGGQHVIANTCTHVSDWRVVKPEPDRG